MAELAERLFYDPMLQFISVIQAILLAGKQLQKLKIDEEDTSKNVEPSTVRSMLLRKLIGTASSSSVINTAAKLLSVLNKEAAEKRDLHNLFIISDGRFSEVKKCRIFLLQEIFSVLSWVSFIILNLFK